MSKSRGNVVDPWEVIAAHGADAFRWYYLTAQQPWAGYRFSVDTVGESVRQFLLTLWNTYSFWVLYANAEDLGPDRRRRGSVRRCATRAARDDLDRWALSRLQATIATVRERMDDFDCTAAGRAIAEYVEELSNWYVRLSRRRFWDGDRAAFATLRHCLLETAALLAPFIPSSPTRSTSTSPAASRARLASCPTRSTCATSPRPTRRSPTPSSRRRWRRCGAPSSSAAPPAPRPRSKVRQPLRRAVIVANDAERAAIERRADLVTAELNVKELDFVTDEARAGQLRGQAQLPRARPALRQAHAAGRRRGRGARRRPRRRGDGRRAARSGSAIDGDEHTLGPDDVTLALQPLDGYEVEAEAGHAVALQLELDDELRREGLAREIVHAVQNARKEAGLEITDRIELALGGDDELLDAARAHEAYLAGEVLATSVAYDAPTDARHDRRPRAAIAVRRA